MTDPQRPPGTTPRRAEPLQPDRPARGRDAQRTDGDESPTGAREAAEQRRERQEQNAGENVREGYGG